MSPLSVIATTGSLSSRLWIKLLARRVSRQSWFPGNSGSGIWKTRIGDQGSDFRQLYTVTSGIFMGYYMECQYP